MAKGIDQFLKDLFVSEGGGKNDVENKFGYIGKYQFGEDALIDLEYYKGDSSKNRRPDGQFLYDWLGEWTGKNGATSKAVFLASPAIQDQAARDWIALLCKRMKRFKLAQYIGETFGGVEITESGIIAAAHLKGFGNAKHPGVNQFLRSKGAINGKDGFGTSVSAYMKRFAGYELGCCEHLVVCLRDREKAPIGGLPYEIRKNGKPVRRGETDPDGLTSKIALPEEPGAYQVLVARVEGGMKQIADFAAPLTSALVNLMSPKVSIGALLEQHRGLPGNYPLYSQARAGAAPSGQAPATAAGNAEKRDGADKADKAGAPAKGKGKAGGKKARPGAGKAKTSTQRGVKGNPVAVAAPVSTPGGKLSGAAWVEQFPNSTSIDDLTPDFAGKVHAFVNALKAGGVKVTMSTTFRPRERAYLMHYSCKVAGREIAPDKVPPMDGVDIDWAHRAADGTIDLAKSRAAAQAMMDAYVIVYPPALVSRHTQRRAVDMTIRGFEDKTVSDADGKEVTLTNNASLFALGATYGVIKLIKDRPHWSDDGH